MSLSGLVPAKSSFATSMVDEYATTAALSRSQVFAKMLAPYVRRCRVLLSVSHINHQRKTKHMQSTPVKTILMRRDLPRGCSLWVERTAYGVICAKADFHPDDPIVTLIIGTARECAKAISTVERFVRNNRRGQWLFGKHAPLDWPQHVARRNQLLGVE